MNKQERFNAAVNYLKGQGTVRTQKDVALKMGAAPTNVSGALKGNDKMLTDNFLRRFNRAFGNIFNIDYLLGRAEEMFCPPPSSDEELDEIFDPEPEGKNEVVGLLKKQLEDKDRQLADKDEEIKFLRQMLLRKSDL